MKDPRIIERAARTCRSFDGVDWERFIELLGVGPADDLMRLLVVDSQRRAADRSLAETRIWRRDVC